MFTTLIFAQRRNGEYAATGIYDEQTLNKDGLDKLYIFKSLTGSTVSYTTTTGNTVNIYTYTTSYASDRTLVPNTNITVSPLGGTSTMYTVSNLEDSKGLVFDDNNMAKAVWIIDYSLHLPNLRSIEAVEADDKCSILKLKIDKDDILEYRGTSGQVREVDRKYQLSYNILKWDEDVFVDENYILNNKTIAGTEILLGAESGYPIPNKNTQFTLRGDQYGEKFGIPSEVVSSLYEAVAVEGHMTAEQRNDNYDNVIKDQSNTADLGGSALLEIDFKGYANEPVANFYSWYIYEKKDMKNPVARYADKDISYVFDKAGDYLVRFEVANTNAGCFDTVSVQFNISESELKIPNYFSPRGTPGVNDEFKVAYKSLVKFKCTIFNRWGNKIYEWSDPSQGWDGRYGGKYVNPGVYYYVIEAVGSEGKKYKKAGDINILN